MTEPKERIKELAKESHDAICHNIGECGPVSLDIEVIEQAIRKAVSEFAEEAIGQIYDLTEQDPDNIVRNLKQSWTGERP